MLGGCVLATLRTLDPLTYIMFITPAVTTPIGALVAPFVPGMAAKAWAGFRKAGDTPGKDRYRPFVDRLSMPIRVRPSSPE
jgi:hypothetical protein